MLKRKFHFVLKKGAIFHAFPKNYFTITIGEYFTKYIWLYFFYKFKKPTVCAVGFLCFLAIKLIFSILQINSIPAYHTETFYATPFGFVISSRNLIYNSIRFRYNILKPNIQLNSVFRNLIMQLHSVQL